MASETKFRDGEIYVTSDPDIAVGIYHAATSSLYPAAMDESAPGCGVWQYPDAVLAESAPALYAALEAVERLLEIDEATLQDVAHSLLNNDPSKLADNVNRIQQVEAHMRAELKGVAAALALARGEDADWNRLIMLDSQEDRA